MAADASPDDVRLSRALLRAVGERCSAVRITSQHGVVYPHLIEAAIMRHRSVANCGVVGIGEEGEQEIVAAVLLKDGVEGSADLNAEIAAEASRGAADHERPQRIVFVDELPTVLGGAKVQRAALRDQLTG